MRETNQAKFSSKKLKGEYTDIEYFPVDPTPLDFDIKENIPRVKSLSMLEFASTYFKTQTPVIITDVMHHWPALSNKPWNRISYLKVRKIQRFLHSLEIIWPSNCSNWNRKNIFTRSMDTKTSYHQRIHWQLCDETKRFRNWILGPNTTLWTHSRPKKRQKIFWFV